MRYGFNTSKSIARQESHDRTSFPQSRGPLTGREAIRIGDAALTYRELAGAATATAHELHGAGRVAVWAEPTLELAIAVVGALAAGVAVVPINPGLGPRELGHILEDSAPETLRRLAGRRPAGRSSTTSPAPTSTATHARPATSPSPTTSPTTTSRS